MSTSRYADTDTAARHWLVLCAIGSMALGIALFVRAGRPGHVAGAVATSVIPSILLALHGQRSQRRIALIGEYPSELLLWVRRTMVAAAVVLAGLHGYYFAKAWEIAALS